MRRRVWLWVSGILMAAVGAAAICLELQFSQSSQSSPSPQSPALSPPSQQPSRSSRPPQEKETVIVLSDTGVTVDGQAASTNPQSAVYVGARMVYYEAGRDGSYGEGTAEDAHSAEEADRHVVVTITRPGTYRVSGELSAGQLSVDLGEDAADDPQAVVT